MNRRALGVLGLAAVLLLTLAAWLHFADERVSGLDDPLLPGLRGEFAELSTLRVSAPGPEVVATLELRGERWVVAERDDWPADTRRLRELLLTLAEARRVEPRTGNPAQWPRLGVAPMEDAAASGIELALETPTGPVTLVIGNVDGPYTNVRLNREPTAWLVSGVLRPARSTGEWLDPAVPDLTAAGIATVTIRHPDGEQVRLQRQTEDANDVSVLEIPDGRRLLHATIASATLGALSTLRVEELARRDSVFDEGSAPVSIELETFGGETFRLLALTDDDGPWLTVDLPEDTAATLGLTASLQPLAGRALRIPRHRFDQLTRRMEDLLAPTADD